MTAPIIQLPAGINKAANVLKAGGVVALPTETFYGLAASIEKPAAINRIFTLKNRDLNQPLPVLIEHLSQLESLVNGIPPLISEELTKGWPAYFTILFPAQDKLDSLLQLNKKIAVRLTLYEPLRDLIRILQAPITGTSANLAGQPPAKNAAQAAELDVDLVLDGGTLMADLPSTIIDPSAGKIKILRQGAGNIKNLFFDARQITDSKLEVAKTQIPNTKFYTYQNESGYRFNQDSIFLAEFVEKNATGFKRVADIGAGTGVLGFSLLQYHPNLRIDCIEIEEEAHRNHQKAVKKQKLASCFNLINKDIASSKYFLPGNAYDLVIMNPPYYNPAEGRTSSCKTIKQARFSSENQLEEFILQAARVLKQKARLGIVISTNRLLKLLRLIEKYSLSVEKMQTVHPTANKKADRVMLLARKNINTELTILPPLIIYDESAGY
ncbi:MAG: L-threonylcarbamoyladenylate synthase [Deltaproteobacteria bacterium]|nr:L-threonylcarbamoyladenylate synthase [Deltaproteobacteria bacterium]